MARTLVPLMLLAMAVGCRSGGNGRSEGSAPRGFDTPRGLRGSPPPDDPSLSIEEQQRRGRARYGLYDETRDPQEHYRGLADRYGPTAR